MAILKKSNVERIVADDAIKDKMLEDGWDLVELEEKELTIKEPTIKEIKALLDGKGIEYEAKAKKEDLIALLEGAE